MILRVLPSTLTRATDHGPRFPDDPMTFLNPLALFGLLAAAIPVLLHLLNLRRLRTVEFSTLTFLKELQRTRIRRVKIRQILLLILRTLLIISLVLAFARPSLRGSLSGFVGAQARTSAVILLDDTPSMTARNEAGELFLQARSSAQAILGLLADGDDAAVLPLSAIGRQDPPTLQRDLSLVRRTAASAEVTNIHRTLEDGLRAAARVLHASRNVNREIYLLSDLQTTGVTAGPERGPETLFEPGTRAFILPLTPSAGANGSVEDIQIPSAIRQRGRPLTLQAVVHNHGDRPLRDHVVSVTLAGARVAERAVDVPPGTASRIEFTLLPQDSGWLTGAVELESDGTDFDNRASFAVFIPPSIRILAAGAPDALRFLRLAVQARSADSTSGLQWTELPAAGLSARALRSVNALFLVDPGELRPDQVRAVGDFLQNGGGVVLFPGPATTPEIFQRTLGPLGVARMEGLSTAGGSTPGPQDRSFLEFRRIDRQHPVFQQVFDRAGDGRPTNRNADAPGVESPRIERSARFVPPATATVVIALSDGSPFLIDQKSGRGRLLTFSVPPTTAWSDLPTRGIFAPLMDRVALYAAQEDAPSPVVRPGDDVVVEIRQPAVTSVFATDPAGHSEILPIFQRGLTRAVRLRDTQQPGVYRIAGNGSTIEDLCVTVDPAESDLAVASESDLETFLGRFGIDPSHVRRIDRSDDIPRTVTEARYGTELWRSCLIAALLLALAELAVAREARRGNTPTEHGTAA